MGIKVIEFKVAVRDGWENDIVDAFYDSPVMNNILCPLRDTVRDANQNELEEISNIVPEDIFEDAMEE